MGTTRKLKPSGGSFLSPLRYPGGKGRMGPWLASVVESNGIKGGTYVEPYAGGAGAALYLLLNGFVERVVINDIDRMINTFWKVAVNHSEALIDQIKTRKPTMRTREFAQQVMAAPAAHPAEVVAFATFFLNRTSRSGILNGGVIGGHAQEGVYKLNARYKKANLISRIRAIAERRKQIEVCGEDALKFLQSRADTFDSRTLIYLDPPYFVKGSLLYRNCYVEDDHRMVAKFAQNVTSPLLITYDDVPEIRAMYRGVKSTLFSLKYSTHLARPDASEVLFYRNVKLPMPPTLTRRATLPAAA